MFNPFAILLNWKRKKARELAMHRISVISKPVKANKRTYEDAKDVKRTMFVSEMLK